jgi:hypothetical protein
LVDVLLVVFYFILVRQAEISEEAPYSLSPASATPEALWLLVIFSTYVFWDLVTDVWKEPNRRSLPATLGLFLASAACSLVCAGLAYLVWSLAYIYDSWKTVVFLDVALLCVVLLFRVIKGPVENGLRTRFPRLQKYRAFNVARERIAGDNSILLVLIGIYAISVVVATHTTRLGSFWNP